jgi:hypothetical protein
MHYLSSVYSLTIPLHVSGILVAHHQEVTMYGIYTMYGTCIRFVSLRAYIEIHGQQNTKHSLVCNLPTVTAMVFHRNTLRNYFDVCTVRLVHFVFQNWIKNNSWHFGSLHLNLEGHIFPLSGLKILINRAANSRFFRIIIIRVHFVFTSIWSQCSAAGIATRLRAGIRSLILVILFPKMSTQFLGPLTNPSI